MGEGILTMESKHRFSMEQRRDCKVTGVVEVHSFDENNILMETVEGIAVIFMVICSLIYLSGR